MRWAAMMVLGLGLGLASGAAAGCPHPRGGDQAYESQRYERWNGEGLGGYAEHGYAEGYDERTMVGPPAYAEPAPYDDGYGPPASGYSDDLAWAEADGGGWYIHGHRAAPCARACLPQPPCDCLTGSVALNDAFFADAGGVGPIPADVYYGGGGGFGFVGGGGFAGASSRAFASASARASTSVSIRSSGGFKGGGFKGGHGGGKHH